MFVITKWCSAITDDSRDKIVCSKPKDLKHKFRLLDDDGVVYAYGYSDDDSSFAPLDRYQPAYGCTELQYKNPENGKYETL